MAEPGGRVDGTDGAAGAGIDASRLAAAAAAAFGPREVVPTPGARLGADAEAVDGLRAPCAAGTDLAADDCALLAAEAAVAPTPLLAGADRLAACPLSRAPPEDVLAKPPPVDPPTDPPRLTEGADLAAFDMADEPDLAAEPMPLTDDLDAAGFEAGALEPL